MRGNQASKSSSAILIKSLHTHKDADNLLAVQSRVVEIGFQGLVQLFVKQSREGMGRMFEPETLLEHGKFALWQGGAL